MVVSLQDMFVYLPVACVAKPDVTIQSDVCCAWQCIAELFLMLLSP